MVLAANEPRFVVDLDAGGGLSGHLLLGVSLDHGPSKWLHQFSELDVRYVDGRMEYLLADAAFPGLRVQLSVLPLAESVGLVMKLRVEGLSQPGEMLWVFGGASGFTTNYNHDAPQYRFSPDQCGDNVIRWENGRFTLLRKGAAVMRGGASWHGGVGFGDPEKVMSSPAAALWVGPMVRRGEDDRKIPASGRATYLPPSAAHRRLARDRPRRQNRVVPGRSSPGREAGPGAKIARSSSASRSTPPTPT